ncbi:MAG: hypothetical protein AAGC93_25755 [Cyanobacteria bacterium P01_F01_bin.53]
MSVVTRWLSATPSPLAKRFILLSFPFLVVLVLGQDSLQLVAQGVEHGQLFSDLIIVPYFVALLFALQPEQRLMAFIFLPFSAVAEYIFSLIFGLYAYRLEAVPLYVPFGHAVLFSMGLLVCELPFVRQHEEKLRPFLIGIYIALFSAVILLLHDTLSAVFGLVFLWVLRRKGYQTLYFVMGFLVLYIELLGTGFGCWAWVPHPFGLSWLQATSPPFGAFVCYVLGDIGGFKMIRFFEGRLAAGDFDSAQPPGGIAVPEP